MAHKFYERNKLLEPSKVINIEEYTRCIRSLKNVASKLKRNAENAEANGLSQEAVCEDIYVYDDNTFMLGLCGNYMASVSPKFLCPFDTRSIKSFMSNRNIDEFFNEKPQDEFERIPTSSEDYNSNYNKNNNQSRSAYKLRCEEYCCALEVWNFTEYKSKMSGVTKFRATPDAYKTFIKTIEEFQIKI